MESIPPLRLDSTEESRLLLQRRLALLAKILFIILAVTFAAATAAYLAHARLFDTGELLAHGLAGSGTATLGITWWLLSRRRALSLAILRGIDTAGAVATGLAFGIGMVLSGMQIDILLFPAFIHAFAVFGRVLIVPSSARRTLILSAASVLPVIAASVVLCATGPRYPPASAVATAMACAGTVFLATMGSWVIYGLREQVHKARQLGQYVLGDKLGEGGMGAVYRARHALLRRPTAVKLLRPDRLDRQSLERFEREVQLESELNHPNVVTVYDYGRSLDGVFYYVMEHLDGMDLERLVGDFGSLPPERVVHVLDQICAGLGCAHRSGLVHGDIKPANVLLCRQSPAPDAVKLVDFGLAVVVDDARAEDGAAICGTPGYLAPEVAGGIARPGETADLYAVGGVAYFLLTGQRVFAGSSVAEICRRQATETPLPPSERTDRPLSEQLEQLVLQCLARDPDDRPASARALGEALAALPEAGQWGPEDAERWWREAAQQPADDLQALVNAETVSLSVALDDRLDKDG